MIKAPDNEADRARENRERVAAGFGNKFYDRQASMTAGWQPGQPPPRGLIMAEDNEATTGRHVPYVSPARGYDED